MTRERGKRGFPPTCCSPLPPSSPCCCCCTSVCIPPLCSSLPGTVGPARAQPVCPRGTETGPSAIQCRALYNSAAIDSPVAAAGQQVAVTCTHSPHRLLPLGDFASRGSKYGGNTEYTHRKYGRLLNLSLYKIYNSHAAHWVVV